MKERDKELLRKAELCECCLTKIQRFTLKSTYCTNCSPYIRGLKEEHRKIVHLLKRDLKRYEKTYKNR